MAADALLPEVTDVAGYARLRGLPDPWLPAVRVICARHGLDPERAYAERRGTNVLFQVAEEAWIKLFPPPFVEDFMRERAGLAAAAGLGGLALPRLLHEGEVEEWPYLVLSHVPGRPIGEVWGRLEPEEQVALARELGALLARLHALDTSGCALLRAADPRDWGQGLARDALARQEAGGLDPAWRDDFARLLEELGPPAAPSREVLLHADVTDEHVFLERRDGAWHVTGLIDFGDAALGDPEYEFAAPLVFLAQRRPAVQRALLEGHGLAPDAERGQRLLRWCLLHRYGRLAHYAACTPGRPPRTLEELTRALWTPA